MTSIKIYIRCALYFVGKEMRKKIEIGIVLVITILFLMPSIQAIQTKLIKDNDYRLINLISFQAYVQVEIEDISGLESPIPPGEWVSIPLTVKYSTNIPAMFKNIIPWPFNNLFLFYSFYRPMQKIMLEAIEDSEYIDIVFSENIFINPILYEGEETKISTFMYICIAEDTPCDKYNFNLFSYCEEFRRIESHNFTMGIEFTVDY